MRTISKVRSAKARQKTKVQVLSESDLLAMYRCFLYTKMGVRNDESKPTDKECLDWLQKVMAQAEHRIDGPLLIAEHPPLECLPIRNTKTVANPEGIRPVIRRFDFYCGLPEWRGG